MRLLDLYPLKGVYQPGEAISLQADLDFERPGRATLRLTCTHLAETIQIHDVVIETAPGEQTVPIMLDPRWNLARGYGVQATLLDAQGRVLNAAETAFDVCADWTDFPRYGFLTDFTSGRTGESALRSLARFHINGLQFYDWQFRHDQLLPPEETYQDPLGRSLSLASVCKLIELAHAHGMAAMAYLAVYAASLDFAENHPAWRLYDAQGRPAHFEDFLGLMDPSPRGPWSDHLIDQCGRALGALPFDGLHVDQYGDPKQGFNAQGAPIDLPGAFQRFIGDLKARFPQARVTFNAVGNWPIEALATSAQDFVYIEIWPPTPTYQDLYAIVRGGREKSGGKGVVVALYIPAAHATNIRLADALIFATGGSRIELGEQGRLLSDPYFPEHEALPLQLATDLRRMYDFAVRYGDLIGPAAPLLHLDEISVPEGIWPVARGHDRWLALHLINFTGLDEVQWCQAHAAPRTQQDVQVSWRVDGTVRQVWWASPEHASLALKPLSWQAKGDQVHIKVPCLEYWDMLVLELEKPGGAKQ